MNRSLCCLFLLAPVLASAQYKIYRIGPSGATFVQIGGLNNLDQVCGNCNIGSQGRNFVGTRLGGYTFFDPPSGYLPYGLNGITDDGWAGGIAYNTHISRTEGCVWDANGVPTLTGLVPGFDQSMVYALNAAHHATGAAHQNSSPTGMAILWTSTGGLSQRLPLAGFTQAEGRVIMDDDTIFGNSYTQSLWRATQWNPAGVATALSPIGSDTQSQVTGANRLGVVVGYSYTTTIYKGVVWTNGQPAELPKLPGAQSAYPVCITNGGTIVGASGGANTFSACIWQNGNVVDMNTLVDPSTPGWTLEVAWFLNDNGVIVGSGRYNGETNVYFIAEPAPASEVFPQDVTVSLGLIRLGDVHSLGAIDGDTFQVQRFVVPNLPTRIQFAATAVSPFPSISALTFATYGRMAQSGAFNQRLNVYNFQTGDYDLTDTRVDSFGTGFGEKSLVATGNIGRYRRSDGLMRGRVTVTQAGPASSSDWWTAYDRIEWRVRP
ncbi:MAG: hypothetical protein JSS66_12480 [Armatimonadetes bacterium]|nr:hypothetical protein [Armatimonadota bacterium]